MWQCGLTATILARECQTEGDAAAYSIRESERRATEGKTADSFPAFASKALLVLEHATTTKGPRGGDVSNRMSVLEKAGVRYQGNTVNRTMMTAVKAVAKRSRAF